MLERLVSAITDLPVIVQGALGSALFASLLFLGQKLLAVLSGHYAKSSVRREKQALLDELATLDALTAESVEERTYHTVIVIYRSARYAMRGLFWLTLGLAFTNTISVFGIIGFWWCSYYLLQAMRTLQGVSEGQDHLKRREEVQTRLREIRMPR